ncbi:MAG TPA: biopolymer transporter ExbD [Candidatus Sulfotelmatobacter sp.]|jgi:biopolymer transport protein ExbD|nr:biopolymer transporter ExbD [Candidatus Sulfotelmatobacter sp.]
MKFPRNAKILRSQFDIAPFAAIVFCLLIFFLLAAVLPVPGLRTRLSPPAADDLPGVDGHTVAMAVDSQGQYYYENQPVSERQLQNKLIVATKFSSKPPTLIIHADRSATYDQLAHITLLARSVGITNAVLATLPRVTDLKQ